MAKDGSTEGKMNIRLQEKSIKSRDLAAEISLDMRPEIEVQ